MADRKLSASTAITALDDADLLMAVDVSDTTDGAGGTNKKITRANLKTDLNNISAANATDLTDSGDSTLHYHAADRNTDNHTSGTTNKVYTATEQTKLAGVATSANNYVHPNHSGDVTSVADGATTIANKAVTLAKMNDLASATIIGRVTASTGVPEALTATQATSILNAVVGDTGSGGTKGLAPAPAAGDAAGGKFLKADGTWAAPAGGGDMTLAGVQSVTGLKTFDKDKIAMKGTSTGVTTVSTANTSATSYTATLPAKDGTIAMTSDIVSQVEDSVTDGHTTVAPSGNAVFDALALKAPLASPTFTGTVTVPVALTGVLRADTGVVSVDSDVTDIVTAGTSTAQGKLELATDAETVTGTDTARATTPANITAKMSAPGAIGNTTASTGKFTSVETTGVIELGHATDTTIARVSAGVASIEGVNILTVAGDTMTGNITLGENTSIALDPAGSADGKYSGITVTGTGGATIAFGDLVTLDKDDSRWELVDISVAAAATGDARGVIGVAVTSSSDGGALTVLLNGIVRADANFPALTIGAPVYASTAGDIVVTQPTTTDHVIRIVGYALTADEIYFNPGNVWTTHT